MKPDISVVVPLHNEAPNVLPLAERVMGALDHALVTSELILVMPWRMISGNGMNAPNHIRILNRGNRKR